MRKKWLPSVLALAMVLSLALPARAAEVPVAEPDVRTSLAQVQVVLDETDGEGYYFSVDYVFVIDQQGVLWQYKSGKHLLDAPITGEFQKTQITANAVQIEESNSDGICILRADGTLAYLHVQEDKLYEVASGVSSLAGKRYVTQQGEVWLCCWDDGGRIMLTPEGAKREREPGLRTEKEASGRKWHTDRAQNYYITTDHVLHYEYHNTARRQKEEKTLEGVRSIWVESAGPSGAWDSSVFFAITLQGDLYARGINSCGYVGNGGDADDTSVQTWGVHIEDLLDKTTPSAREVYTMTRILSNVERVWTSDRAYALDKDGNYWTWGDPSQTASVIISTTRKTPSDEIIEDGGKNYYATAIDLPTGKPYASPRKMKEGEKVSLLRDYRQDENGALYAALGEQEYALPHTGGVLGGVLNLTVGEGTLSSAANTAYASTQTVLVDGKSVEFQCYALKDQSGNDTNYIKLRDIASVLNGTSAQFQVGWNGAVNIETGKTYTPNGSEMNTPFSGSRGYEAATAATNVNGAAAALEAIVLKDDAGGAYTYYKLRDLGAALGFQVDWSAEKGIFIETK